MKTLNKIIGIGLIALIAMVGIGAVSAYEIYDDTNDQPSVYYDDSGVEYRDTIKQTTGGITVDDWNVDTRDGFGQYEYHFYKNEIDIRPQGIGYDADPNLNLVPGEYNIVGSTFTGNHADANGGAIYYTNGGLHDGNLYFYTEPYYTNGMTGSLSDGNGNLLTVGQSGFVVPGSDLNPPRPDINIPYYPTEQTDIVLP